MAYYPIVRHNDFSAQTSVSRRLPTFYMEDFSVLGLRVNDCDHAVRVLDRHAFMVRHGSGATEVSLDTAAQIQAVVQLLEDNGLKCEISDLAESMYQG